MALPGTARGLALFISNIRNCNTKEAEEKRVQKEMANIRGKFTSSKTLGSYDKKKYVWKLVYIFMLGYEVDFGHMEVINLLSSNKYSEKHVGYLAISVLLRNTDEMMTLIVNSIRTDLNSNNEFCQSLALCAVANLGGKELTEALSSDVNRVLTSPHTRSAVRKKASLCLLRLYRTDNDIINPADWVHNIVGLLNDHDLGVVISFMGLLQTLVVKDPEPYKICIEPCIQLLKRLTVSKQCKPDYMYYATPSPWLQVKILQLLQHYSVPKKKEINEMLNQCLNKITTKTDVTKSLNKNNADHAILFEAVNLIIHYGDKNDEKLREQAITLLGKFIIVREPNIRYLGLSSMSRLASMAQREGLTATSESIRKHQSTILFSLKDNDISIRKKALDLVFAMCTHDNSIELVKELLNFLITADYTMKEEMVLKIAILAEKYATDYRWYLDSVLQLITIAGDYVNDDIWHRVVQIVTNREDLQKYSAQAMYTALQPIHVHESTVKVAAYILGEFGYLLTEHDEEDEDEDEEDIISSQQLFDAMHKHFLTSSDVTKSILLHSYMKLINLYEDLSEQIEEVFDNYRDSLDSELQQRACEYYAMPSLEEEKMHYVLEPMPPFPEDRANILIKTLETKTQTKETPDAWVEGDDKGAIQQPKPSIDEDRDEEESEENESDSDGSSSHNEPEESSTKEADLLDMGATTATASAPLSYQQAPPPAIGANGSGAAPASTNVIGIDPSLIAKMKTCFLNTLVTLKGVLFEDSTLQIGIQHQYKASQGQIMLFFGNLTNDELVQFSIEVPEISQIRFQINPIENKIEAKKQLKQMIKFECMAPFTAPPELKINFMCNNNKHSYNLRLPVATVSFMEPVTMPSADFIKRWQSLTGSEREQQAVFDVPQASLEEWNQKMLKVNKLAQLLHFAVIPDVDANQYCINAASTMRTGTVNQQTGQKSSVGCLMRIEFNPQQSKCRLIVKAVHAAVAANVKTVVQQQLTAGTVLK